MRLWIVVSAAWLLCVVFLVWRAWPYRAVSLRGRGIYWEECGLPFPRSAWESMVACQIPLLTGFLLWVVPCLLAYVGALSYRWVLRGFKDQAANTSD